MKSHLSHLFKQLLLLFVATTGIHYDEILLLCFELLHALLRYGGWICLCVGPVEWYLRLCGVLLQLVESTCITECPVYLSMKPLLLRLLLPF